MHALLSWIAAHPEAAATIAMTFLLAGWKALPDAQRAAIERRYPRAANGARAALALLPDLVKFARVMPAVVRGVPKPDAPAGGNTVHLGTLTLDSTAAQAELDALIAKAERAGAALSRVATATVLDPKAGDVLPASGGGGK
jgi:hypothetical protein